MKLKYASVAFGASRAVSSPFPLPNLKMIALGLGDFLLVLMIQFFITICHGRPRYIADYAVRSHGGICGCPNERTERHLKLCVRKYQAQKVPQARSCRLAMTLSFPYTYISCPCSDHGNTNEGNAGRSAPSIDGPSLQNESPEEEDQKPFDPRHPRSNFSLFPPEHLLYCEECHEIKCPRCISEEQISYFCTSCLFETPSSAVRSEGNRYEFPKNHRISWRLTRSVGVLETVSIVRSVFHK